MRINEQMIKVCHLLIQGPVEGEKEREERRGGMRRGRMFAHTVVGQSRSKALVGGKRRELEWKSEIQ